MQFKPITPSTEQKFRDLRRRINKLQSGGTVDSLINIGANVDNLIGASYLSLKNLALRYDKDYDLALLLWNTQKREEQIVSCFLLPDDLITEKIIQLMDVCMSFEIATYIGSVYLYKHKELEVIVANWSQNGSVLMQNAALTAAARFLILNKDVSQERKDSLNKYFKQVYSDKHIQALANRYRLNSEGV